MAETVIVLYLSHFWTKFDEILYAKIFLPTWKAYQFSSNLKLIFIAFYSSMSPLHPLLRHNIPVIKEAIEIANCAGQRVQPFHINFQFE